MKSTRHLIAGDDGLPAEEVGVWVIEKHEFLKRYLDISRATRQKFLGDGNAGATYIDLFCSTGRARIRETGAWIDGSAVSASTRPDGRHASSVCDARERPFES
jgi:three-Cys-motif partner protein